MREKGYKENIHEALDMEPFGVFINHSRLAYWVQAISQLCLNDRSVCVY